MVIVTLRDWSCTELVDGCSTTSLDGIQTCQGSSDGRSRHMQAEITVLQATVCTAKLQLQTLA